MNYLGIGLVTRDLKTGAFVPFLAESWKISADGLTYEFKLKRNVKFHDGTPLTAKDYVYTIQRHKDPALKSPTAQRSWGSVASAEAPDDYTLILKLSAPDATFMFGLALTPAFNQPIPKPAVEKMGAKFTTQPVLAGPFKFKESQTGFKIVLERNPDFDWGPPGASHPPYIQTLEYRSVSDYATILAGLESGEIDIAEVQAKDIDRLTATGKVHIEPLYTLSFDPTVAMNVNKAPWDDVRVRKAINLALDRQALIKVVQLSGRAEERRGPVAKGAVGYWQGVEKIGYGFDLNQAKALMKEAGYTEGSGGVLEKDGKPLKFTLKAWSQNPYPTVAQVVKQQLKALGIDLDIQLGPVTEVQPEMQSGKFDLGVVNMTGQPNGIALMRETFHSSYINALNLNRVNDPQLDELLDASLRASDETRALEFVAEAQKLAVEKAYSVPLYTVNKFYAVSNRIKGLVSNEYTFRYPNLFNAYIESGK
ncbi:MAG: hypothetical protein HY327_12985 [Chloroflexi bacterium]|nr:hypothetical protein [Chloroflexota bacterium]